MDIQKTSLDGLLVLRPKVHADNRGFFLETYRLSDLQHALGREIIFRQQMHARSQKNVLRGLHAEEGWSKLFYVVQGEIFSAITDIRKESSSFGKTETFIISDENRIALFVPAGFSNGYYVLSSSADVMYAVDDIYRPERKKRALRWNDPDLAIPWPSSSPVLSEADTQNPGLRELFPEKFR